MKALSIRAPWWWAILHGKNIENRDWHCNFRGVVLIHASKWWNAEEVRDDWEDVMFMARQSGVKISGPSMEQMRALGGHIVGSVEIVDCVTESASPWFVGKYGFVLRHPITYNNPMPFKGALGFFDVPDDLLTGDSAA